MPISPVSPPISPLCNRGKIFDRETFPRGIGRPGSKETGLLSASYLSPPDSEAKKTRGSRNQRSSFEVSTSWEPLEPSASLPTGVLNPDSAVAIDRKCETQPLRSKVEGFLPLSRYRSAVLGENTKLIATTCESAKMTLQLH